MARRFSTVVDSASGPNANAQIRLMDCVQARHTTLTLHAVVLNDGRVSYMLEADQSGTMTALVVTLEVGLDGVLRAAPLTQLAPLSPVDLGR